METEAQTDLFIDCKDANQGAHQDAAGANPSGLNPDANPDEFRDDELPGVTIDEAVDVVLEGMGLGAYWRARRAANAIGAAYRERYATMPRGMGIAARAGRGEEDTGGGLVAGAVKSMRRTKAAPAPGGNAGMGIAGSHRSGSHQHGGAGHDQATAESRAADVGPCRAVEAHAGLERAHGDEADEDQEGGEEGHAAAPVSGWAACTVIKTSTPISGRSRS